MVAETRRVELALGAWEKSITENEQMSVVVQRRCLRASRTLKRGTVLQREDISVLRPATGGAVKPDEINLVIGATLTKDVNYGEELRWSVLISQS